MSQCYLTLAVSLNETVTLVFSQVEISTVHFRLCWSSVSKIKSENCIENIDIQGMFKRRRDLRL